MAIEQGQTVWVTYEGTFEDGTVFDNNKDGSPLEFTAGGSQVIKGFSQAVIGMNDGESKKIIVKPEDGYGNRDDSLQQKVERSRLPQGQQPTIGTILGITTPDGRQFPATVTAIDDTTVTLDLNHPLAGKTLHFNITVVKSADAPKDTSNQSTPPSE